MQPDLSNQLNNSFSLHLRIVCQAIYTLLRIDFVFVDKYGYIRFREISNKFFALFIKLWETNIRMQYINNCCYNINLEILKFFRFVKYIEQITIANEMAIILQRDKKQPIFVFKSRNMVIKISFKTFIVTTFLKQHIKRIIAFGKIRAKPTPLFVISICTVKREIFANVPNCIVCVCDNGYGKQRIIKI